jgi:release factor glutamine methyltransferase
MISPPGDGKPKHPSLASRIAVATKLLERVSETPRLDAELLMAHALGISRAKLLARLIDHIEAPDFDGLVARRLEYEPLAYIFGSWEFYSLEFRVTPPLLVPRPETEHLVEAVLSHIGKSPARILEIGTGTGCVAVSIAKNAPSATVIATDVNPLALDVAAENASRHGVSDRVQPRQGHLFEPVTGERAFDVICSNPPYIEDYDWPNLSPVIRLHEDPRALLAGPDGLDVIRQLISGAKAHLKPEGLLAFEIGMGQHTAVRDLLIAAGYHPVNFIKDLAGIERIAVALASPLG